jgi:tRNA dimethylallyltransferase
MGARQVMIVGPTASGKSELALRKAGELGAEIVSLDAFQVYRGLDVGTGKLRLEQRRGIPHHLIDCADALEPFSVADYLRLAGGVLRQAGDRPLVWVGGTGLYAKALTEGLCDAPEVGAQDLQRLESLPLEELQDAVRRSDPAWWERANPSERANLRRLARVAGVAEVSDLPLSAWQGRTGPALLREVEWIVLDPEREALEKKIRARVASMLESGWVEEVETLLRREGWEASPSASAIGYREVARLARGETTRQACEESICVQTRQYAKRQRTWFARRKSGAGT